MYRQSQPDNLNIVSLVLNIIIIIAFVWGRYVVISTKQQYIDCILI
jgi:nitrogen fixation-related uncharacterized protein